MTWAACAHHQWINQVELFFRMHVVAPYVKSGCGQPLLNLVAAWNAPGMHKLAADQGDGGLAVGTAAAENFDVHEICLKLMVKGLTLAARR